MLKERKEILQKNFKYIRNTTGLETEGYISGIKIGEKKKKQYAITTAYGNNTSVEIPATIKTHRI